MKAITEYPQNIEDQVINVLTAYPSVYVFNKDGQYRVSTGIALTVDGNDGEYAESQYKNYDFYSQVEIDQFNTKLPDLNW